MNREDGGESMKSIKTKIIAVVIFCSLISAGICGAISIANASKNYEADSKQEMLLTAQNQVLELNASMEQVEQSVDTLYDLALGRLDDVNKFKTSSEYVDSYTEGIKDMMLQTATHTKGALTAYIRYNPEFTEPTSGIFMTRDDSNSAFSIVTPTDFSMYDPSDVEHVGWYYIPVENKQATWMTPYLNSNINVYMVSYVVPIYVDGESIGIVGMDIDFSVFTDMVDESDIFTTGYAFLSDADGNIVYHKGLDNGTAISAAGEGLQTVASAFSDSSKENQFIHYSYQGKDKVLCYETLQNGMKFVLTAPKAELRAEASRNAKMIFIGEMFAVVIAAIIGFLLAITLTKPILQVDTIVSNTAEFDFSHNAANEQLYRRKDETAHMAKSLHVMRKNLRGMVADIRTTYDNLKESMEQLAQTTEQVSSMSNKNSDTTQQLAAAMEETAATMEDVNDNITDVRKRADAIEERSRNGKEAAVEVRGRADQLRKTTDEASAKTTEMYESVQQKTVEAIERAKAVEKINQLTQAILEISSQTNLLALNASIEAARAGDAGRGFAVVAEEIGQLATQTSQTVGDINNIIDEVNGAVKNMADCLKESTDFLESAVLKDYGSFSQVAEEYTKDAATFENDMNDISREVDTLLAAIVNISDAADSVSRTVNDAANGVTDIAQKTQDVADMVETNTGLVESNQGNMERLRHIIAMFKNE